MEQLELPLRSDLATVLRMLADAVDNEDTRYFFVLMDVCSALNKHGMG